jgi:erythromycin esterase-like protein
MEVNCSPAPRSLAPAELSYNRPRLAGLPSEFDIMIFFDRTTAAVPLPMNYPTTF